MLMDCAMSGSFFKTYVVSEIIKSFYNHGIESNENYIYVRRTTVLNEHSKVIMGDTTKTYDSTRKIPINDKIRGVLDQVQMPTDGSTVFKAPRGGLVQNACVNRAIRDTLKKLKEEDGVEIEHFTSHALRDTFAANWVRAHKDEGGALKTLKVILGHAKLAITADLYVHVLDDTKIAGMKKMDKV